jgi:competence protein ComEC
MHRHQPSSLLLLLLLLPWAALAEGQPLVVHFFDVGQGDAALILSPTGRSVLIDGGPPEAGEALAARVDELVEGPLDLVILTHPHLDHLGGLKRVLERVGARRFMDPGIDHPTVAYRKLLEAVGERVGEVRTPELDPRKPDAPVSIGLGEGVTLTILWPRRPVEPFLTRTRSDANSNSIVARLSHGSVHFLFTGDAEPDTEAHLLERGVELKATVLKVGHHGSRWASGRPFLAKVRPEVAVISVGASNEYGHPAPDTLRRLEAVGARVFRTDVDGEVRAVSDGKSLALSRAREPPPAARGEAPVEIPVEVRRRYPAPAGPSPYRYVAPRGTPHFHREDCRSVTRLPAAEKQVFSRRSEAAKDHRAAEDCNP